MWLKNTRGLVTLSVSVLLAALAISYWMLGEEEQPDSLLSQDASGTLPPTPPVSSPSAPNLPEATHQGDTQPPPATQAPTDGAAALSSSTPATQRPASPALTPGSSSPPSTSPAP